MVEGRANDAVYNDLSSHSSPNSASHPAGSSTSIAWLQEHKHHCWHSTQQGTRQSNQSNAWLRWYSCCVIPPGVPTAYLCLGWQGTERKVGVLCARWNNNAKNNTGSAKRSGGEGRERASTARTREKNEKKGACAQRKRKQICRRWICVDAQELLLEVLCNWVRRIWGVLQRNSFGEEENKLCYLLGIRENLSVSMAAEWDMWSERLRQKIFMGNANISIELEE